MDIDSIINLIKSYVGEYKTNEHPFLLFDLANVHENDHTRVLMSILRYNNNQFLPSFLQMIGAPEISDVPNNVIKQPTDQMKAIGNDGKGFIDLYFEYHSTENKPRNEEKVIIENKIYGAGDTPKQLARYIATVLKIEPQNFDEWYESCGTQTYTSHNIHVVYLTSDGTKEPSEGSLPPLLKDKICYYPISYFENIIPWLENDVLPQMPYSDDGIAIAGIRQYVVSLKAEFNSKGDSNAVKEFESKLCDKERYEKLMEALSVVKSLTNKKKTKNNKEIIEQLQKDQINLEDILIRPLIRDLRAAAIDIFSNDGTDLSREWKLYFTPSFICLYKQRWADVDSRKYSIPSIYLLTYTNSFFKNKEIKWRIQIDHLNYKNAAINKQYTPFCLGNHDMTAYFEIPCNNLRIEAVDDQQSRKEYYKNLIEGLSGYISLVDEAVEDIWKNYSNKNYFQEDLLKVLSQKLIL